VHQLARQLAAEGARTKITVSRKGTSRGGVLFSRGALFHLLKSRTYLGEMPHKEVSYPGVHPAIIDPEIFDAVQAMLTANAGVRRERLASGSGRSPLKGVLFDADGVVMSPVAARNRHGQTYRYYVSANLQQGAAIPANDDVIRRISAAPLEAMIGERLGRLCPAVPAFPNGIVTRVEAMPTNLVVTLKADHLPHYQSDPIAAIAELRRRLTADERIWTDEAQPGLIKLSIAVRAKLTGGRTEFLSASGRVTTQNTRRDAGLIRGLRKAKARYDAFEKMGTAMPLDTEYDRRLLRLAFLAPDIQRAILDGRQPSGLTLQALRAMELPISWDEQRSLFYGDALPQTG